MVDVKNFRDLIVWQKAMDLAAGAYSLARQLPKAEEYRLTSQLLRSAAAVPANIAEGNGRGTRKDYARFISIAYGSLGETETHLLLLVRIGLVAGPDARPLLDLCAEIGRMLNSLRQKLRDPPSSGR